MLKMLYGIGHVDRPAVETNFIQSLIEDAAGWPDKRASPVFLSARLFADHQDGCRRRSFAANQLRRIEAQRAAFELRCLPCANSDALERSTPLINSPDFAFKGGRGSGFIGAYLLIPLDVRFTSFDRGRNNAIDSAMKILAVTFKGVLRTVRWRPQQAPGPFRDLPDRQAAVLRRLRTRS
jgi:hypothetical protein